MCYESFHSCWKESVIFNKLYNISSVSIHAAWQSASQARDHFNDLLLHASLRSTEKKKE